MAFENHTNPLKAFDVELAKLATQEKSYFFQNISF